jgi:hypothetical protein
MDVKMKKRLFFLKAHPTDLKSIEGYLSKRDFDVEAESDLRDGILKLIPFEPTYVFIAWDHPNEKILSLPKVINQSSAAIIIPYTSSPGKDQIRKLDSSGYTHKLYPPVSGPSIMRLLAKIDKQNEEEAADPEFRKKNPSVISSNGKMITGGQSNPALDQFLREIDSVDKDTKAQTVANQKERLSSNQQKLKSFHQQNLDAKLKKLLQNKFENEVRGQIQEGLQTAGEGRSYETAIAEGTSARKLLCVVIQSASWCGYLLVGSQVEINNEEYRTLIQSWLQDQLVDMSEISNHDYFEVQLAVGNYAELKTWAEQKSDYIEFIQADKNEIFISFFTLDPKYLMIELNENHEMLEVPLEMIDVDQSIPFSLFIHLPENKKYLLYTLPHQSLLANQKNRLMDKSVHSLFTPIEFEAEFKKLKAEKYLNSSYDQLKKSVGT